MATYEEDRETDGREENEEAAMLEDHENGDCDDESCFWCLEAVAEEEEAA